MKTTFTIDAVLWIYPGEKASWHFLTVPKDISLKLNTIKPKIKRGWGSVKVRTKIGSTEWETSVFPDKRSGTYILPVKKSVRTAEGLYDGDKIRFFLTLL